MPDEVKLEPCDVLDSVKASLEDVFFDTLNCAFDADLLARAAIAAIEATRPTAVVTLPCDVRIPPNTLIEAGCKLDTLLTAMSLSGRPKHFADKANRPTAATDDVVKELVVETLQAIRRVAGPHSRRTLEMSTGTLGWIADECDFVLAKIGGDA